MYYLLMAAGFTSMGVEIVWIRLFTPGLGTVVYAFSTVLAVYLVSTYIGSVAYRRGRLSRFISSTWLLGSIGPSILLPLLICDPRLPIVYPLRVLAIVPFSLVVGFLSPMILDRTSQGDPTIAGKAYAINVLGCVLGPLVSGFLLLPAFGERFTLLALAIPWIAVSLVRTGDLLEIPERFRQLQSLKTIGIGLVSAGLVFGTNDFESQFSPREVRRDSVATVTAAGSTRVEKNLLVNGVGVTGLTPVTKMIAHLPLAFMPRPPKSALVICFGMGTTHRSILSWGVQSTAVELVPSVVSSSLIFSPTQIKS